MTGDHVATLAVAVAGAGHFIQIPAMLIGPRYVPALRWSGELAKVSPLTARIVRVMVLGIVLCVVGLGGVVVSAPAAVAHDRLGASLALFLGLFWTWRAWVQVAVYGAIWPSGRMARLCHRGLAALFTTQGLTFLAVAVRAAAVVVWPGSP